MMARSALREPAHLRTNGPADSRDVSSIRAVSKTHYYSQHATALRAELGQEISREQMREFHTKRPWRHFIVRSEEHTSELQSPCNLVCRLLLQKTHRNAKRTI